MVFIIERNEAFSWFCHVGQKSSNESVKLKGYNNKTVEVEKEGRPPVR